jgi:hypothetical protein
MAGHVLEKGVIVIVSVCEGSYSSEALPVGDAVPIFPDLRHQDDPSRSVSDSTVRNPHAHCA